MYFIKNIQSHRILLISIVCAISVLVGGLFFFKSIQYTIPTVVDPSAQISSQNPNTLKSVNYFVNPNGDNANDGLSGVHPFKTIQKALDAAGPGDIINLSSGVYHQDVKTTKNGLTRMPITIIGPSTAVIKGTGDQNRIFEINHNYIHLIGFTIDGYFVSGNAKSSYLDKLLYIQGMDTGAGIHDIKILHMQIKNGGGECLRMRYFAHDNEIAYNTIQNCGIHDFRFSAGGKNGEGIYIGTAPEQRGDGKNPTDAADVSSNNWIHHNTIDTQGNECVDLKESTRNNVIEYNVCSGQKDPESAGFDSRGDLNVFRYNEVFNTLGAGFRLGGDLETDGIQNEIYGNKIKNTRRGAVSVQRMPQGKICENQVIGVSESNYVVGKYKKVVNPTNPC